MDFACEGYLILNYSNYSYSNSLQKVDIDRQLSRDFWSGIKMKCRKLVIQFSMFTYDNWNWLTFFISNIAQFHTKFLYINTKKTVLIHLIFIRFYTTKDMCLRFFGKKIKSTLFILLFKILWNIYWIVILNSEFQMHDWEQNFRDCKIVGSNSQFAPFYLALTSNISIIVD